METIKLSNGGSLPALSLGTWKSKPDKVTSTVEMAIKAGYRHIDCAAVYGNEKEVGQALKSCIGKTVRKFYGLILSDSLWPSVSKVERKSGLGKRQTYKILQKKLFKVFAGLLSGLDLPIMFTSLLSPQKDVRVPTKQREYACWCWVRRVN